MLDIRLGLTPTTRKKLYKWGAEKFNPIIAENLPCISEFVSCYKKFQQQFATDPNPKENRWPNQPLFYNPQIRWGTRKEIFTPQSFGLPESASELSLGQLFANLKPISRPALETLGFKKTQS